MVDTEETKPAETEEKKNVDGGLRRSSRFKKRKRRERPFSKNKKHIKESVTKVKGTKPKMRGHVFQCHGESPSSTQYTKTCEELQTYVSATYRCGSDVKDMIRTMKDTTLPMTKKPIISETEDD